MDIGLNQNPHSFTTSYNQRSLFYPHLHLHFVMILWATPGNESHVPITVLTVTGTHKKKIEQCL